jgi:hypothetical protein
MSYEREKKQYIGPWENNLKHGVGTEVNFNANTRRRGEWKAGKWLKWVSSAEPIDPALREQML